MKNNNRNIEKLPIKKGFTNNSFKMGKRFFQEKKYTGFNHFINYEILKCFRFVPKLFKSNEKEIEWKFIEGKEVILNDSNIRKIARRIKKIHNSNLNFPPFNHASRVKNYRKIIHDKGLKIPVLEDFYKKINNILSNMDKNTPCHNDLWAMNMIEDKNGYIYIVDWEYATLGDKYFDLAYFIEGEKLNVKQETLFLKSYKDYIDNRILIQHKILVNYLVVLWAQAQDVLPFATSMYEERIYSLAKLLN